MAELDPHAPRGPVFLTALRQALSRFPLWFLTWLVPLLLALVLAVPWANWFEGVLENRYRPGSVLAGMDADFRQDHKQALGLLRERGGQAVAPMALLAMLFGVFAAGGWLQVLLERTSGHSLRRFLWGGARYFWRFFRVWLLALLSLALVTWVLFGWVWDTLVLELLFGATDGDVELLDSELSVARLEWLQSGLYAAGFALVLAWGDYTRTRLALHGTRSALWAGLCTWGLLLRHPVQTLRPFLLVLGVELAAVLLLGWFSWGRNIGIGPETGWPTILVLLVLGQLAMMWQAICRGARYAAAVHVSRRLVQPLLRPDPWGRRVGGPGGPQYPIDDSDDYGVSI